MSSLAESARSVECTLCGSGLEPGPDLVKNAYQGANPSETSCPYIRLSCGHCVCTTPCFDIISNATALSKPQSIKSQTTECELGEKPQELRTVFCYVCGKDVSVSESAADGCDSALSGNSSATREASGDGLCAVHHKKITAFCLTHIRGLCEQCVMQHKSCLCKPLDEYAKDVKERLDVTVANLEKLRGLLNTAKEEDVSKTIQTASKQIDESLNSIKEAVDTQNSVLHEDRKNTVVATPPPPPRRGLCSAVLRATTAFLDAYGKNSTKAILKFSATAIRPSYSAVLAAGNVVEKAKKIAENAVNMFSRVKTYTKAEMVVDAAEKDIGAWGDETDEHENGTQENVLSGSDSDFVAPLKFGTNVATLHVAYDTSSHEETPSLFSGGDADHSEEGVRRAIFSHIKGADECKTIEELRHKVLNFPIVEVSPIKPSRKIETPEERMNHISYVNAYIYTNIDSKYFYFYSPFIICLF